MQKKGWHRINGEIISWANSEYFFVSNNYIIGNEAEAKQGISAYARTPRYFSVAGGFLDR